MKFETYEDYVKATKEHYSKKQLTIPVDFMVLSKEMFELFNGNITFGASKSKCNGDCNCNCKKE